MSTRSGCSRPCWLRSTDELVVGIVPVTGMLDLKHLAAAVGGKRAEMADPKLAQRRTGYVVGGISPIGQRTRHRTVLDETAELWDTVYVSGGRRGFDLELAPERPRGDHEGDRGGHREVAAAGVQTAVVIRPSSAGDASSALRGVTRTV